MSTRGTQTNPARLPGEPSSGVYNSSAPTLNNGDQTSLQLDVNGNLKVTGGGGGGGNASVAPTGATVPADATFVGAEDTDTGNLVGLTSTEGALNTNADIFSTFIGTAAATWTSATSLNTALDSTAEGSAASFTLVQTGTLSTGAVTFEQTADGNNWAPILLIDNTTNIQVAGYTFISGVNRTFSTGFSTLAVRARLSTAITGSGSVLITQDTYAIAAEQQTAVELTDGTNIIGTSTHPVRIDPTGTTLQPVSGNINQTKTTPGYEAITDGTNGPAAVKAASTAPVATDPALVVVESPNSPLTPAQASTTSGQVGPLVQGAVTSVAPVYTASQTDPLSLCVTGALRVAPLQTATATDAATARVFSGFNGTDVCPGAVALFATTNSPATGSGWQGIRTPAVFKSAMVTGGIQSVWGPQGSKKARLMRYRLSAGEDCSYASANTPIFLDWVYAEPNNVFPVSGQPQSNSLFQLTHRVQIPTTALATNGVLWDSDWIDLGNGQTPQFTNQNWYIAMSVAQPTSAITPTWTIASNQWEALTMGFKSVGNLGGARLRQAAAFAASSGVVSTSGLTTASNSSIIVIVRTNNPAGGAPTTSIADNSGGGNVYTGLAAVTNASDGTHGSTLQMFYCLNMTTGYNGATMTVTTTGNVATAIEIEVIEVAGIVAIGTTSQSTGTGNSTSPASASYTPGEAGDYIIAAMGTAANLGAIPNTVSVGVARSGQFSGSGTMVFADNLGNGTLATGGICVVACGTEE